MRGAWRVPAVGSEAMAVNPTRRTRARAILDIFVAAALITPTPGAFTPCLMAVPMCLLYELCIWLAYFDARKRHRQEEKEERQRAEEDRQRMGRLLISQAGGHANGDGESVREP
jgi:sec-independent protein translocase protein TatC